MARKNPDPTQDECVLFDWDDGPDPLPWWWVAAVAGGVLAGTAILILWLAIRVVR